MIQPTIGRVVLFKNNSNQEQAQPALICFVHSDRYINVGGFDNDGVPFRERGVTLLQDNDPIPEDDCYAEWMPYQKEVQAKAEAYKNSKVPIEPSPSYTEVKDVSQQ